MKNKIGFMALAIITVLATLGIGFSMWSQSVVVTGTVNTGSLGFTLSAPTGTWVYKDETSTATITTYTVTGAVDPTATGSIATSPTPTHVSLPAAGDTVLPAPWPTADNSNVVLIGCAYTVPGFATNSATLTMTWVNLFPIAPFTSAGGVWNADFILTNTSSIPVKFHAVYAPVSGNLAGLTGPTVTYTMFTTAGQSVTGPLEGTQFEPGTGLIHVNVGIVVPDSNSYMSMSGSFTLTIQAVQWNEFTGTSVQS